jgi:hypothetical protein
MGVFAQQLESVTGWIRYELDGESEKISERKYDIEGRLLKDDDYKYHAHIVYAYDSLGRVVLREGLEGEGSHRSSYVYEDGLTIEKYENINMPEVLITEIYYNQNKKETERKMYDKDGLTARLVNTYDENEQIVGETHYSFGQDDTGQIRKTFYQYDPTNKLLLNTISYNADESIAYQIRYQYNQDETLKEVKKEHFKYDTHQIKLYNYHANGTISSVIEQDLKSDKRKVYTYSYFPSGKMERESIVLEDESGVKLTYYKIYKYRSGSLWQIITYTGGSEGQLNSKDIDIYNKSLLTRTKTYLNDELIELIDYNYTFFE